MGNHLEKSNNLSSGEFYGTIANKRQVAALTLSEVNHSKKVDLPAHNHKLAAFTLLLNGSYSENYHGKDFSYQPMTVWWHPPNTFHKDEVGKKGGRFFIIEVQTNNLENLNQIAKTPQMFYEKKSQLVNLACRFYHEFKNWQVCSEMIAVSLTLEMLAYSVRKSNKLEKQPPVWLARVINKLNDEFAENLTADELAAEADVHPIHLAAVFRKFHQQTIGEYVQNLRIQRALELLANQEIPLCEIALLTGFSDQSHFTRIFKRITGITPGVFRKTLN
jgi:AraC family transcriptional regulator